jgi:CheY-like chemotaxis protein
VRLLVQKVLEGAGWRTLAAPDGRQGLDLYAEHRDAIDLVLLDLTTPQLSGREVVTRLRELTPDLPILIMSGYPAEEISQGLPSGHACGFIQKPFAPAELLAAVATTREEKA